MMGGDRNVAGSDQAAANRDAQVVSPVSSPSHGSMSSGAGASGIALNPFEQIETVPSTASESASADSAMPVEEIIQTARSAASETTSPKREPMPGPPLPNNLSPLRSATSINIPTIPSPPAIPTADRSQSIQHQPPSGQSPVVSTPFPSSTTISTTPRQQLDAPQAVFDDDENTEPSSMANTANTGDQSLSAESEKPAVATSFSRFVDYARRRMNAEKEEDNEGDVADGVLISGYLQKLGRNGKWQTRWFETDGECLSYYKSSKRTKLLATLDLEKVKQDLGIWILGFGFMFFLTLFGGFV